MGKRSRATRAKHNGWPQLRPTRPAPRQPVLSTDAAVVTTSDAGQQTSPETPLAVLKELVAFRREVEELIDAQVDVLAGAGTSWPVIAEVLGVSRQAARQAHQRRHAADNAPEQQRRAAS